MKKKKIIKFKNGGELIYNHVKGKKYTAMCVGFKVGHYHNGKKHGLAHFLEHMLFKQTKNRDMETLEKERNEYAPNMNALTNHLYTCYVFSRTNKLLEKATELLSDQIFNPNFTEQQVESEKGVIKEELRRWKFNYSNNILPHLDETLGHKNSLYSISYVQRLGEEEDIDKITPKDLYSFKEKHYNLNNFISIVSTSLPLRKIKKLIQNYFVKNLSFDPNYVQKTSTYFINKKENMNLYYNEKDKMDIIFTFKINKTQKDLKYNYNYYSIGPVIYNTLFNDLRNKGLIYTMDRFLSLGKKDSNFSIHITSTKSKLNEILKTLNETFVNIKKPEFLDSIIETVKNNFIYNRDEQQSPTLHNRNMQILKDYIFKGDINNGVTSKKLKKLLKNVSSQSFSEVAKEVFSKKSKLYVTVLGNLKIEELPSIEGFKKELFD